MRYLWFIPLAVLLFSCTGKRQQSIVKIKNLREKLYSDEKSVNDMTLAHRLDSAYKDFADQYPKDTATAAFLYLDAQLNQNILKNTDQANVLYRDIFTRFPKHRLAPDALFAFAFNNEQLGRLEVAKSSYELFLQRYPSSDLANDARNSIKYLGKDPSEIIKDFEAKKQDSSAVK